MKKKVDQDNIKKMAKLVFMYMCDYPNNLRVVAELIETFNKNTTKEVSIDYSKVVYSSDEDEGLEESFDNNNSVFSIRNGEEEQQESEQNTFDRLTSLLKNLNKNERDTFYYIVSFLLAFKFNLEDKLYKYPTVTEYIRLLDKKPFSNDAFEHKGEYCHRIVLVMKNIICHNFWKENSFPDEQQGKIAITMALKKYSIKFKLLVNSAYNNSFYTNLGMIANYRDPSLWNTLNRTQLKRFDVKQQQLADFLEIFIDEFIKETEKSNKTEYKNYKIIVFKSDFNYYCTSIKDVVLKIKLPEKTSEISKDTLTKKGDKKQDGNKDKILSVYQPTSQKSSIPQLQYEIVGKAFLLGYLKKLTLFIETELNTLVKKLKTTIKSNEEITVLESKDYLSGIDSTMRLLNRYAFLSRKKEMLSQNNDVKMIRKRIFDACSLIANYVNWKSNDSKFIKTVNSFIKLACENQDHKMLLVFWNLLKDNKSFVKMMDFSFRGRALFLALSACIYNPNNSKQYLTMATQMVQKGIVGFYEEDCKDIVSAIGGDKLQTGMVNTMHLVFMVADEKFMEALEDKADNCMDAIQKNCLIRFAGNIGVYHLAYFRCNNCIKNKSLTQKAKLAELNNVAATVSFLSTKQSEITQFKDIIEQKFRTNKADKTAGFMMNELITAKKKLCKTLKGKEYSTLNKIINTLKDISLYTGQGTKIEKFLQSAASRSTGYNSQLTLDLKAFTFFAEQTKEDMKEDMKEEITEELDEEKQDEQLDNM